MTPLLQTAGWTLIHFVWQGAAIAAVIAAALRLLRDRSADARYLIACAGLVLMIAAPAATARLMWDATTGFGIDSTAATSAPGGAAVDGARALPGVVSPLIGQSLEPARAVTGGPGFD